jgi:sugar/nucleoside kinase (ribokinase family)
MAPRRSEPRVLVLGDLLLDAVLAPDTPLRSGTDVAGRVVLRQGGSAASTARWLARLGARVTLVTAVGRDPIGRALVTAVRRDRVTVRVVRVAGAPTGRIGVLVSPDGERSFVADRGAADLLPPEAIHPEWFRALDALHLPIYSLLGDPIGRAARRAIELVRSAGGAISLDLASSGPLMATGRHAATSLISEVRPDILFATASEAEALLGPRPLADLLSLAPIALVKRGPAGAAVLVDQGGDRLRFDIATERIAATDSTGAGDAFDAGALVAWLAAPAGDRRRPAVLRRAAHAGQRAAIRQLTGPRPELALG